MLPLRCRPWERGHSKIVYMGRSRPDVQTLIFSYTMFYRKGKITPLSYFERLFQSFPYLSVLPFYIPTTWKRFAFWAHPLRIVHCWEYPPSGELAMSSILFFYHYSLLSKLPALTFVTVGVKRMRQCTTFSVKRIRIPMASINKADKDVSITKVHLSYP